LLFSLAALAPYNAGPASPAEARSSMIDALLTARLDGVVGVLHGHTGPVNSVAFNSDGSILASGNNDHTVRLWKVDKHRQVGAPLRGQGSPIESVAFSPVSATLAAGDQAGHVRIWDVASHPHVAERFQAAHRAVNDLTFSPGGLPDGHGVPMERKEVHVASRAVLRERWACARRGVQP
jgi:WD40 repeat protein